MMDKEVLLKVFQYKDNILRSLSDNKKIQYYCDLCMYIKSISNQFYDREDQTVLKNYYLLVNCISDAADLLPFKYIISNHPNTHMVKNIKTIEDVLDSIVQNVRNEIRGYNVKFDLKGKCSNAAIAVQDSADYYSLPYQFIRLYPGFSKNPNVCNGSLRHCLGIISYNDKKYLIDCSYSQFFLLKRCMLDRIGLIGYAGASPGLYMKMDNFKEKVAKKILTDGWIELAPGVLKAYLDGFALSYRNGLYYEQTQDFSYTTPYSDEDYWHFLDFEDNQFNYEDSLTLGYQSRPLKNPEMTFYKR